MTPTMSDSRTQLLRSLPIFAASGEEEIERVDGIVDEIEVDPGEVVLRENEEGCESFIIVSGTAKVTIAGLELTTLGPGDFFGEMALLDGKPRAATVTADTTMHLLVVDEADFATLIEQPGVAAHMLRTIAARLRDVQRVRPANIVGDVVPAPQPPDPLEVWREPVRGGYPDVDVFELPGREQLERFFTGDSPRAPITHLTGLMIEELSEDRVVFAIPASDWFLSSQEHVSAGALTMLADAAFGCAVMLGMPGSTPFSTSELSMTFLKPCRAKGVIRAIGTPISDGRPLAIAQTWIEDDAGERVAFGTSTCFVQPPVKEIKLPQLPPVAEHAADGSPDPFERAASGQAIAWERWRSMSGHEILARQIAGDLPQPPIHYLTGMTLREAGPGRVTFTMPAHRWLTSALRTVQGGAIAMLAHAALATAATATLEAGEAYRPVDVKVNFLRPVFADGLDLVATGVVTHRGRTLAVATADVVGPGGKKVATATGSTMITPNRD